MPRMKSVAKGKAPAVWKRKRGGGGGDDDKTGKRAGRNRAVLQFFEDEAYFNDEEDDLDSDDSFFDDEDFMDEEFDIKVNKEPPKAQSMPFVPKEEEMDEEEFDRMMEERYKNDPKFFRFAEDDEDGRLGGRSSLLPSNKDPPIWKVKCMVGRERNTAFCLMQKFIDLKTFGNKLQIISAFAVDHVKGFIFIEAEKECDIMEASKGICGIYYSRVAPVPRNDLSLLLSVRNKPKEVATGMWVRVKGGIYKGDLGQIVAVNDIARKVTVKLIPRIDLQALAQKFGGGVAPKKTAIPAPRLLSSSELEEFRPLVQYRKDRDTGEMCEILDGLILRHGFLYKKVPIDSLSCQGVMPQEEELLRFQLSENNNSDDLEWLTQLYGGRKKKRTIGSAKGGDKGESSSDQNKFELYELVCFGRKDYGLIVGMEKDGYYKILKDGPETPVVVTLEVHELKNGLSDMKFTALDHHKKIISINDTVRVLEGSLKDREGVVKHIYRGTCFIYNEIETDNGGYFCCKAQMCEKIKLSFDSSYEKGVESAQMDFGDCPSSPKSPLRPRRPWQAKESNHDSNRGDENGLFTVGQTLRIRVGPLKGYLCCVLAIRHSDVTVKLDSQQKVLQVKSEHLSEVRGKSSSTSMGEDPGTSSFKPFDLLGTDGGSGGDCADGAGTSADGDRWNTGGGSNEGNTWSSFPGSNSAPWHDSSLTNPSSAVNNNLTEDADNAAWDKKVTSTQSSSWGASGFENAAANGDQAAGWGKNEDSWNKAPNEGISNQNSSWGGLVVEDKANVDADQGDVWSKAANVSSTGTTFDSWAKASVSGKDPASFSGWKQAAGAQDNSLIQEDSWGKAAQKQNATDGSGGCKAEWTSWTAATGKETGGWGIATVSGDDGSTDSWNKLKDSNADLGESCLGKQGGDSSWSKQGGTSSWSNQGGESPWVKQDGEFSKGKQWGDSSSDQQGNSSWGGGGESWGKKGGEVSWGKQGGESSWGNQNQGPPRNEQGTDKEHVGWKRSFDGDGGQGGRRGRGRGRGSGGWRGRGGGSRWSGGEDNNRGASDNGMGNTASWGCVGGSDSHGNNDSWSGRKTSEAVGGESWSAQGGKSSWSEQGGNSSWGKQGGDSSWGKQGGDSSWNKQDGGSLWGQKDGGKQGGESSSWGNQGGDSTWGKQDGDSSWNKQGGGSSWGQKDGGSFGKQGRESSSWGNRGGDSTWHKQDGDSYWGKQGGGSSWGQKDGGSFGKLGGESSSCGNQHGDSTWDNHEGESSWSKNGAELSKGNDGRESSWGKQGGESSWNKQWGESSWGKQGGELSQGKQGEDSFGKQGGESSWGKHGVESSKGNGDGESSWGKQGGESSWGKNGVESSKGNGDGESSWGKQEGESSWSKGVDSTWGKQGGEPSGGKQGVESSWNKQGGDSAFSKQGVESWGNKGGGSTWGKQGGESSWSKNGAESSKGNEGEDASWGKQGGESSWKKEGEDSTWGKQGGESSWGKQGEESSWSKQEGRSSWHKYEGDNESGGWKGAQDGDRSSGGRGRGGGGRWSGSWRGRDGGRGQGSGTEEGGWRGRRGRGQGRWSGTEEGTEGGWRGRGGRGRWSGTEEGGWRGRSGWRGRGRGRGSATEESGWRGQGGGQGTETEDGWKNNSQSWGKSISTIEDLAGSSRVSGDNWGQGKPSSGSSPIEHSTWNNNSTVTEKKVIRWGDGSLKNQLDSWGRGEDEFVAGSWSTNISSGSGNWDNKDKGKSSGNAIDNADTRAAGDAVQEGSWGNASGTWGNKDGSSVSEAWGRGNTGGKTAADTRTAGDTIQESLWGNASGMGGNKDGSSVSKGWAKGNIWGTTAADAVQEDSRVEVGKWGDKDGSSGSKSEWNTSLSVVDNVTGSWGIAGGSEDLRSTENWSGADESGGDQ